MTLRPLLRHVVLLFGISGAFGTSTQSSFHGDTTSATSTSSPSVHPVTSPSTTLTSSGTAGLYSRDANSTCPSRTVNYITHTLPRQCLRTDRVPHNSSYGANTTTSTITPESTGADSGATVSTTPQSPTASDGKATTGATHVGDASPTTDATDTSASTPASSSPEVNSETTAEEDADSPLDNANFLSFEEWKRQNLAKTGQSPEDVGRQAANPDRPRPVIHNALDSLGEEGEIDLDFTGFGGAVKPPGDSPPVPSAVSTTSDHVPGSGLSRSKDAGKTCKERTNYASFDCSATVLKSNKECKSASSVLVENKDSYMLNVCSASNKFFIVELCTDIQIDTIVLANYEFFSSSFRHFRVSVSDRFPVKMEKWRELGTFEARNTREIQAFLVENPLIWAKYLRIEFLSQYGTEYYCPVSLLRVHGTTMIEDFRHQAGFAAGDDEDTTLEAEVLASPTVVQEPAVVAEQVTKSTIEATAIEDDRPTESITKGPPGETTSPSSIVIEDQDSQSAENTSAVSLDEHGAMKGVGVYEPMNMNLTCDGLNTSSGSEIPETPSMTSEALQTSETANQTTTAISSVTNKDAPGSPMTIETSANTTVQTASATEDVSSTQSLTAGPPPSPTISTTFTSSNDSHSATRTPATNATTVTQHSSQATMEANSTSAVSSTTASVQSSQASGTANSTRVQVASSTGAQAAQPSTQESFFKSFHKRLLQLESNSTLSLQYIEEQSRILRDAFSKVEKRQVGATSKFLTQLNQTVMTELHGFRQAYDQLWQSTVIELEGQRETYQREMLALSARLTMVADELVWQKRMGIVQSTLLLLCLALVLFGRSSGGYIEMPLMQQMMNRSTAALRGGWESPPNSPSPDSRSPVSLFRRKLWRSNTEPAGETGNLTDSEVSRPQSKDGPPDVLVEPPSPMSPPAIPSDLDDEYAEDSSPNVERKDLGASQGPVSPKKKKKKPKKPPNWLKENGPTQRVKSPLAM